MRSVLAFAALALLAACDPFPMRGADPAPAGGASGGTPAGPLAASFQIQPAADSVTFVLAVTNATQAPLALEFRSGQSYDFAVADGGREVWRGGGGGVVTQARPRGTPGPGPAPTPPPGG